MVDLNQIVEWVEFMHAEEAERYKIEVQQTWATSLGFFGRFISRHYSWFLAFFKRAGLVKISLVWLICFAGVLWSIGRWEKGAIVAMALLLCLIEGLIIWAFVLSSTMASNWKRVDYLHFRKKFVPKELQVIVMDLESKLPPRAKIVVEYFGRNYLVGVFQPPQQTSYFGCWAGRSTKRSQLLFPRGNP